MKDFKQLFCDRGLISTSAAIAVFLLTAAAAHAQQTQLVCRVRLAPPRPSTEGTYRPRRHRSAV